jgi:chromosome segregation ATPase
MIPVLVLALVTCTQGYALREGVTPVQKVIQLLQNMATKGKAMKQDEAVKFSAYKQFCDDTAVDKQRSITEANAMIEQLQADIQKAESDAEVLAQQIAELDAEIGSWEADKKKATEVRNKEHEDYRTTHRDYTESVDALGRAIQILKRQAYDRTQSEALIQVTKLARVPESVKRTIASFLSTDSEVTQDPLGVSAPQANAYEFQSGGVVEMLEKLEDKFKDERNDLEKAEMSAKHAHEMMVQDLTDQIEGATKARGRHASTKAQREQASAEAKGDLADNTASRDEDTTYLQDLNAQCAQKSQDFESRQQLRAEELEAIQKAIEILSSGSVSGNADKHLPGFVQKSFALRAGKSTSPLQKNVASFLEDRATQLQSRILSLVASKVAEDPFEKVRKMIKDLIVRLMEEANEEAEHKGWCDTELASNKQTRETKTQEVDTLVAERDQLQADIAKLGEEISELSQAIANIDSAVAEATEQRQAESAKNKQTVADAKEAQTAVAQALAVLKEFYAKAAEATALVQQTQTPGDDAPETFGAPYQGMGGESGGVVGMLEVIQSDFARLEAETSSSEEEASKEFDRFSAESAKDKAVKQQQSFHRTKTKTQKEGDLNATEKDLKATQEELDAALAYYDKLKPSCVNAGVSYEERVKRRQDEIESLQEALRILEGEDIA